MELSGRAIAVTGASGMVGRYLVRALADRGARVVAVVRSPEKMARTGLPAEARRADNQTEIAARLPYFCAGCPHNSSTKVPEGSRAYAGIGCHYMVQWMDRDTIGFTHMGAEGANWVGQAPFSTRKHIFQNIGDGTYFHSGTMAIRAAVSSGINITYKISGFTISSFINLDSSPLELLMTITFTAPFPTPLIL